MRTKKYSYFIAFLGLVLSFNLARPFCCHSVSTISHAHQEHSSKSTHDHHSEKQDCNCGHELAKDFQKAKDSSTNQVKILDSTVSFSESESPLLRSYFHTRFIKLRQDLSHNISPPLHLLFGVFLN